MNKIICIGVGTLIVVAAFIGFAFWPTNPGKVAVPTAPPQAVVSPASIPVSGPVEQRNVFTYQGKTMSYLLSLPAGYSRGTQVWPMLVFLHGSSLRGNDLDLVKRYGPSRAAAEQANFPLIVLSPQCPEGEAWSDAEGLAALVAAVSKKHRVDPDRVYLAGMSLGGSGVWHLASQHPEYFAAVAPVAACRTVTEAGAKRLASLPIWAIHGEKDTVCPIKNSERTIQYLRTLGNAPRFTVLPDKGHYITEVFANREFYDWLLTHKRK